MINKIELLKEVHDLFLKYIKTGEVNYTYLIMNIFLDNIIKKPVLLSNLNDYLLNEKHLFYDIILYLGFLENYDIYNNVYIDPYILKDIELDLFNYDEDTGEENIPDDFEKFNLYKKKYIKK